MARRFAIAALVLAFACSDEESHGRYASRDCTVPPCSASTIPGGGGGAGGGSATVTDAGTPAADANTVAGFTQCTPDPTTHQTLCLASTQCPGVLVDPASFPNCGYVTSARTLTLACLCNGNLLCPIGVGTACLNLMTSIAPPHTFVDICSKVSIPGDCTDLGAAGSGG